MPKQAMGSEKLNALPFDSTVIHFDLEHHPLDTNISLHRREVNMSLNMHGTQYGLPQHKRLLQMLKFNWLYRKMSKCNLKWARSCYIALP